MRTRWIGCALLLLVLATSLAGCIGVDFSINTSTGSSTGGRGSGNASHSVNGKTSAEKEYKINARAGQTIRINYDVRSDRGSLTLSVSSNGLSTRTLGTRSVFGSEQDVMVLPVSDDDVYILSVDMLNWGGDYNLSWAVE